MNFSIIGGDVSVKQCPCGSSVPYFQCCGVYIQGQALPSSPEALMCSRYTAYSLADTAYIKKTMRGKAAMGFDEIQAKNWALSVVWISLVVMKVTPHATDASIGYVEFIAKYLDKYIIRSLHEISEFHRVDGAWFYVDGQQIVEPSQTVGRNKPCPCGSQKKFKHCHLTHKE